MNEKQHACERGAKASSIPTSSHMDKDKGTHRRHSDRTLGNGRV